MSNTATENKMEQAFALWEKTSEKGTKYLSGEDGIIAFYNREKKSLREADIIVYQNLGENEGRIVIGNLWSQVSKTGRKYLSGKLSDGRAVVGFVNEKHEAKQPLISVYYQERDES